MFEKELEKFALFIFNEIEELKTYERVLDMIEEKNCEFIRNLLRLFGNQRSNDFYIVAHQDRIYVIGL